MEQYFSKQLSNCCQLNFSNHVIKSHKHLLSPKKPQHKPTLIFKKSEKKSLKRVHSDHALTLKNKSCKQTPILSKKEIEFKQQEEQLDDYGQHRYKDKQVEKMFESEKQLVFSAHEIKPKLFKSLDRGSINIQTPKRNLIEELRNVRFSAKSPKPKLLQSVQLSNHNQNQSNIVYLPNYSQKIIPTHFIYPNDPNKLISSTSLTQKCLPAPPHFTYGINDWSNNQSRRITARFGDQKSPISNNNSPSPIKSPANYTQSFKKIYGQVQLEDQIKKDLMRSIQFQRIQNPVDQTFHGISVFTKSPSSEDSTVIPPESKLRKKIQSFQWLNQSRKIKTQEHFKGLSPNFITQSQQFGGKIQGRQKFKSIVSVQSQSSSSEQHDSVIIQQHPQGLVSSKPIKSLF